MRFVQDLTVHVPKEILGICVYGVWPYYNPDRVVVDFYHPDFRAHTVKIFFSMETAREYARWAAAIDVKTSEYERNAYDPKSHSRKRTELTSQQNLAEVRWQTLTKHGVYREARQAKS